MDGNPYGFLSDGGESVSADVESDSSVEGLAARDEEALEKAKALAQEKFEWLTSRAVVAKARHDMVAEPSKQSSNAFSNQHHPPDLESGHMLGSPTPRADRAMAKPGSYRSATKYLAACSRYSLQPNGGALLGLSLGLHMLEVDGVITNLELVPLCAALLDAPFVRDLKLSGHPLQDTGAAVLALALPGCPWIAELELVGCRITGAGAKLICEAIPKSGVQRLVLKSNLLKQNSALANTGLAEVVESAKSLVALDLQSCGLTAVGMRMIKQALVSRGASRFPPCSVDFEGNFVLVEVLNSVSHGVCALICVEGWRRIHMLAARLCQLEARFAVTSFIASMLTMFCGSTLYHSMFAVTDLSWFFKVIDHCAIYVLIAGTYTPVLILGCRNVDTMHMLRGAVPLVAVYWAVVLFGIGVEHYVTQKIPPWYGKFILFMYVLLGFGGVPYIATCPLVQTADVMVWIELGGLTYVIGIVFFLLDKRYPAMHIIWHLLVGLAAFFHFVAVWTLALEVLSDPHRSCTNSKWWSSRPFAELVGDDFEYPVQDDTASALIDAKQL